MELRVEVEALESVPEAGRQALAGLAYEVKKSHPDTNWSERAPSDAPGSGAPDFRIAWTQEAPTEFAATQEAQALVSELKGRHHFKLPRLKFRATPM